MMDEKEALTGAVKIWQGAIGMVTAIGGLIYIGAQKEQEMKNEIKHLKEQVKKFEDGCYITEKQHDVMQAVCQGRVLKTISDEVHEIVIKYAESLHAVDTRLGGMEGDIRNICRSLDEMKKQRDLRLTP